MSSYAVLVTVPQPLRGLMLRKETLTRLQGLARVTLNEDGRDWSSAELAAHVPDVDFILASWGLAPLTSEVLGQANRLRLVAYGAGSVKGFVSDEVYGRGIVICHAAARIADSVADMTLLLAMMGLRRPQDLDRQMKERTPWPKTRDMPSYEIAGKLVGLLGMGYVGQRAARLFQAVGAEVWAYDPYLPDATAAELRVRKVALGMLLAQCRVISVHLPITDETFHLIGARELALIPDGAVFINTARSWAVDQEAMIAELAKGRFWAALDVFDQEPLDEHSPLRRMDNVLLTPHVAGQTRDAYYGQLDIMVDEIERFIQGKPPLYQVTREALARMA